MAVKKDAGAAQELDFDRRLERLEALVAELEDGGLGLEPAIDRYQEGISLLRGCHSLLEGYRKQVEELSVDAQAALSPYEGDPDAEASAETDAPLGEGPG